MAGAVGMDLLEIERMEAALARTPGLTARLFTDRERAYAAGRPRPAQHLAARFCAKEAVVKALGLSHWTAHDIEVVGGGDGPPELQLHGAVAVEARRRQLRVTISLTHTRGMAGAVALAEHDEDAAEAPVGPAVTADGARRGAAVGSPAAVSPRGAVDPGSARAHPTEDRP